MNIIEYDTVKSIYQNIQIILSTPKGCDPHRPTFGSNLWQFVDKPLTAITRGKIKAEIVDALQIWEPRIEVEEVFLTKEYSSFKITIKYKINEDESVETQEIVI